MGVKCNDSDFNTRKQRKLGERYFNDSGISRTIIEQQQKKKKTSNKKTIKMLSEFFDASFGDEFHSELIQFWLCNRKLIALNDKQNANLIATTDNEECAY